jgi:hypothetical protein
MLWRAQGSTSSGVAVVRTRAAIQHSLSTGDEVEVAGAVGAV